MSRLFAALLLLAQPASAQGTPVHFLYLRGTDTIAVETVTPGTDRLLGDLRYKGQPRIRWEQQRTPQRLTLEVFAAGADSTAAPLQVASFTPRGDSIAAELGMRGAMRPQLFASKAGAMPLINSSVLQSLLLSQEARARGVTTLPVFLTSGAQTLDATIRIEGDSSSFTMGGMTIRAIWEGGIPREITIAAQSLRVVRAGSAVSAPREAPIDYGAPPNASYTAERVVIPTTRGYSLVGTLTRPSGATGAVPAVVTISGSGPQDRDSRISIVPRYAPFREIADTLARRGIAVLRYDDRGVGESGGKSSRDSATSADFADDVQSVLAYLRTRREIDAARLAVAGHSEGGLIAPLVATREPALKAVVALAGPSYTGRRILEYQNANGIAAAPNLSAAQRDSLRRTIPAALDSLARSNRWMGYFMSYDPLVTAQRVKQPVLILQGDTDQQVTPGQADELAAALRRGGNRRVTVRHFAATNHLFLADPSGAPQGYASLRDTQLRREVLGALADWLVLALR